MRSLFIKIFFWFGAAMVVGTLVAIGTGMLIQRRRDPPRGNPLAPSFGLMSATAVETFEKGGAPAVKAYLDRVETASRINAVLLTANGEDLSGRGVPLNSDEVVQRARSSHGFVFDFPTQHQHPKAAQLLTGANGTLYVVLGEMPAPDFRPPPRPGEPGSFYFGLGLAARTVLPLLLIGGLFCYWLAKHLSRPIVQLRTTAQGLAEGNLAARVPPALLQRHDEIGNLGRDFNLMAARLESLVEAQRRLIADISHELRSPLARHGVALGLARKRGGPEVTSALDRIALESERINEMIGQLLTLSQLESGTDGFQKLRVDLVELIKEVADDADYEARNRGCKVVLSNSEPCYLSGVPQLLRSAIENVVRNAVRHTAPGTAVEIGLTCETLGGGKQAAISVRDHGGGVAEQKLNEIFRPFYRIDDARDRKSGGTGLGLAIAARAIRLHEGAIHARNAPDGGLIVDISIPI
jgi:signal transduction histidine kinase